MNQCLGSRSFLLPAMVALALSVVAAVVASQSEKEVGASRNPLLVELEKAFQARNSEIKHVAILDLEAINYDRGPHVLVGWGVSENRSFHDDFNDELFGVFIVSPDLVSINKVLEIMPTRRWLDYDVYIERVTQDSVVVRGRGTTYGDNLIRRAYAWDPYE